MPHSQIIPLIPLNSQTVGPVGSGAGLCSQADGISNANLPHWQQRSTTTDLHVRDGPHEQVDRVGQAAAGVLVSLSVGFCVGIGSLSLIRAGWSRWWYYQHLRVVSRMTCGCTWHEKKRKTIDPTHWIPARMKSERDAGCDAMTRHDTTYLCYRGTSRIRPPFRLGASRRGPAAPLRRV